MRKSVRTPNDISNQMAAAVRQSNRQSLDDVARKFKLELGDTPPASVTDPVGDLGNSPDLHQVLFQLRPGELSSPLQSDKGFVILTLKDVQPAHQGTLAEVHDRVLADYQQEQSIQLARSKAEDLAKRTAAGEPFDKVAKSLGIDLKTPEAFARTGSIPDLGSGRQLESAFSMPVGQVSTPTELGSTWVVYKIVAHQPVLPEDLAETKGPDRAADPSSQARRRLRRLPHRSRRSPEEGRQAHHQQRSPETPQQNQLAEPRCRPAQNPPISNAPPAERPRL